MGWNRCNSASSYVCLTILPNCCRYYAVLPLTCLPGAFFNTPLSRVSKTSEKSIHEQAGLEGFKAQHILVSNKSQCWKNAVHVGASHK